MSGEDDLVPKIKSWRGVATGQSDFFLKFAVEYFAFNALLKLTFFPERKAVTDREFIKKLKKEDDCKSHCSANSSAWVEKLKEELYRKPLKKLTRPNSKDSDVKIHDKSDWDNIVEAVYCIRNNLFHGDKYPGDERDQKLVTFGYHLLASFNDYLISKLLGTTPPSPEAPSRS